MNKTLIVGIADADRVFVATGEVNHQELIENPVYSDLGTADEYAYEMDVDWICVVNCANLVAAVVVVAVVGTGKEADVHRVFSEDSDSTDDGTVAVIVAPFPLGYCNHCGYDPPAGS